MYAGSLALATLLERIARALVQPCIPHSLKNLINDWQHKYNIKLKIENCEHKIQKTRTKVKLNKIEEIKLFEIYENEINAFELKQKANHTKLDET